MKKTSYIRHDIKGKIHITIDDEELIGKIVEYCQRRNSNFSVVVKQLCTTNVTIDDLLAELDREKYLFFDEDQKIDRIIELERQLKEVTKNA